LQYFTDLCKLAAEKSGLSDDDINEIFQIKVKEPVRVVPSSIRMLVKEVRPVKFEEKGPIIEVLGDNQTGKTTTLAYIANLLGYDFFNEGNANFLADPNLVNRGRETFSKLQNGMEAELKVMAEKYVLCVSTRDGQAKIEVLKDKKPIFIDSFNLKTQSRAFRNCVARFIGVQFVSKGRAFDIQLLTDIIAQLASYIEQLRKRTNLLITEAQGKLAEFTMGMQPEDLESRKSEIGEELAGLKKQLIEQEFLVRSIQSKLAAINDLIENVIPDLEGKEAFKLYCRVRKMERMLEREGELLRQRKKLESLEKKYSDKKGIYENIEKAFGNAVHIIRQNLDKFSNREVANLILSMLADRDIDSLFEEREKLDPESYTVIKETYEIIKKYDSAIKLPQSLGGSVNNLQQDFESARKEAHDHNLLSSLTGALVDLLTAHKITSSEGYIALKNDFGQLEEEIKHLKEKSNWPEVSVSGISLKELETARHDLDIKRQALPQSLQEKLDGLNDTLMKFKELQPIICAPNPIDELSRKRTKLQAEISEAEKKLDQLKGLIQKSEDIDRKIESILSSPEYKAYSDRIDQLNTFSEILNTLKGVLRRREYLLERDLTEVKDKFDFLDDQGITPALDDAINKTFLERCQWHFRVDLDENRCHISRINSFDYRLGRYTYDGEQQNIRELSGGTASVMTVLSLSSRKTNRVFGEVMLVDEFHDVEEILRREAYRHLKKISGLSLSFFAKPDSGPLRTSSIVVK
jgi:hypothetical protein